MNAHEEIEFEYLGVADEPSSLTEYHAAWAHQREVHAAVAAGELPGRVIFVEHEPVYTAGRQTLPAERPFDGTPVVDVDRGGKITWHGPGQLVGYPIMRLPDRVGVVDHVRRIEQAVIELLAGYDIEAGRVPGRTGVWLAAGRGRAERKICAIGIRVSKRTTMHGFALNISNGLAGFGNIVPCGISDADVTTMAAEMASPAPSLVEVAQRLEPLLARHLSREGNCAPTSEVA